MERLSEFGLSLNKSKSMILAGPTCLKGKTEVLGIPIVKKAKYLGYTLSPVRSQLYHDAIKNINKHLNKIKGKIKFKDPVV
jgi:hypothetical protein